MWLFLCYKHNLNEYFIAMAAVVQGLMHAVFTLYRYRWLELFIVTSRFLNLEIRHSWIEEMTATIIDIIPEYERGGKMRYSMIFRLCLLIEY